MRRLFRIPLFLAVSTGLALALESTAWALPPARRPRHRGRFVRAWSAAIRTMLAIRTEHRGAPPPGPCLFVSNHLGYLDIPVLSGSASGVFVSKDDVRRWPLIGFLAKAAGTIFIARESGVRAAAAIGTIRERLRGGESVFVFPEGTSSRGDTVLPFRSLPFASTEGIPGVPVVPVRIELLGVGGKAAAGESRDLACWHGDTAFAGHFWRFLGTREVRFRVSFGEPLPPGPIGRKLAARLAHERVCALGGKL